MLKNQEKKQVSCLPEQWGDKDVLVQQRQWGRWLRHSYAHLHTRMGKWKMEKGVQYFSADSSQFEAYFEYVERSICMDTKSSILMSHSWAYKNTRVRQADVVGCMQIVGRLSVEAFDNYAQKYDKKNAKQRYWQWATSALVEAVCGDGDKSDQKWEGYKGALWGCWREKALWVWSEKKKKMQCWDVVHLLQWIKTQQYKGVSKEVLMVRLFALAYVQTQCARWQQQWSKRASVEHGGGGHHWQCASVEEVLELIRVVFGNRALFESKNAFGAQYYEEALVLDSWVCDSPAHWSALLCDEKVNAYLAKKLVHQIDVYTLECGSAAPDWKSQLQGRHPLIPRVLKVGIPAVQAYEQCAKQYNGLPLNNKAMDMFGSSEPVELVHWMDNEVITSMVKSGYVMSDNMLSLLKLKRQSAYKISYGVNQMRHFLDNCDALMEGQKIQTILMQQPEVCSVGQGAEQNGIHNPHSVRIDPLGQAREMAGDPKVRRL